MLFFSLEQGLKGLGLKVGSLPFFTHEELGKLIMPTLFIGGENDALLPSVKTANRISKLLPKSKTLVFYCLA